MLQRAGEKIDSKEAVLKIKDASYPAPFASELEYNSPVHGNWNIVHTGMQIPESIQIYVCADNCMRGVVLTAAEMNAADRFSSFPGYLLYSLLYGSDHAKAWANAGSEATESRV